MCSLLNKEVENFASLFDLLNLLFQFSVTFSIITSISRYFLNPNAVSRHLFCSVCQEVFDEPYRAPCGHSFCKKVSLHCDDKRADLTCRSDERAKRRFSCF